MTRRIRAEVRQEEIKGGNRVIVVAFDIEGQEEKIERVSIEVDATKEDIESMLEKACEEIALGRELEERIDEVKASSEDAVGTKVSKSVDAKSRVDERLGLGKEKSSDSSGGSQNP